MCVDEKTNESEKIVRFKVAMQKILTVKKIDILDDLPKMFQERKVTTKKSARKRKTK